MRLTIISQYFYPENFRINELAVELEKTNNVTVVTSIPNYPNDDVYRTFKNKNCDLLDRSKVFRVPVCRRKNGGKFRISLNYISFAISASLVVFRREIRTSTEHIFVFAPSPLTVVVPAIFLKFLTGARISCWILDLWPETLYAFGLKRYGIVNYFVKVLIRQLYNSIDIFYVGSRSYERSISGFGVPREKIRRLNNWSDQLFFDARRSYKFDSARKKILFAGNFGTAQNLGIVSRLVELSYRHELPIDWVFAGEGRERAGFEKDLEVKGLLNVVSFLGVIPLEEMPLLYANCDFCLITLQSGVLAEISIPGRVMSAMASGCPLLVVAGDEMRRLVDSANCGIFCDMVDDKQLLRCLGSAVSKTPAEMLVYSCHSRDYASKNFRLDYAVQVIDQMLHESERC